MNLNYKTTSVIEEEKSVFIENDNFISIEHIESGQRMITAFIGKGENNNKKLSIKVSPHGGILHIRRMSGDALRNAEILLEKDNCNKVVSNDYFKNLYKSQKENFLIEF